MLASGDTAAFTSLYRRYWESLFLTAVKVIRCKQDAADIVQEIFMSLWRRREELAINGSLAAYLQTSVKYKTIHYIEKNITRRHYLDTIAEWVASHPASSAEATLQVKEIQELVHAAVINMPPRMQEVYRLSRQEQLTHKQIAVELGISEETVKKHIQHALQLIRTAIGHASVPLALIVAGLLK
jgi:RNA polymerase sigma-70 factor (ECF subfamily)